MLRLAGITEDNKRTAKLARFLSTIASRSVHDALCEWCSGDDDIDYIYDLYFAGMDPEDLLDEDDIDGSWAKVEGSPWDKDKWDDDDDLDDDYFIDDFFEGIGQYFIQGGQPLTDEAAGKEILSRKIRRMKEKAADHENFYTFDVFEELLFATLVEEKKAKALYVVDNMSGRLSEIRPKEMGRIVVDNTIRWMTLSKAEQETADILMKEFHYSRKKAESTSRQVHRVHEMDFYDAEETPAGSIMFWDDDYDILFEDGFVDGIRGCADARGEMLGYGYDYACEIFTDMGMKPPMRLLGSKEANKIRNRAAAVEMKKRFNQENPFDLTAPEGKVDEGIFEAVAGKHQVSEEEVRSSIQEMLDILWDHPHKDTPAFRKLRETFTEKPTIEEFLQYIFKQLIDGEEEK